MTQYRIVELNSGKYAIQKKVTMWGISPMGWDFIYGPHPEYSNLIYTFDSVEKAREYFIDPNGIKRVVENVMEGKDA